MKHRPNPSNPIRHGDSAYAMGLFGTITDVDGDRVEFRGTATGATSGEPDWRHWTYCFYGPDVVQRVMPKKPPTRRRAPKTKT